MLDESEITRGLVGKYVDTYAFPDGRLVIRWQGLTRPYTAFDKDQRVTDAAITGNKHLSAVLAHIKDIQETAPPPKHKPAGKQRSRYTPTGRRNDGWNSKLAKRSKTRTASQGSDI